MAESKNATETQDDAKTEEPSGRIFTLANLISFIRLCLIPLFFVLLLNGHDIWATIVYIVAAVTDFLDGQIARRTHTISRLGQMMDPFIDRVLMIVGVLGIFLVGRCPLWIIIVVFLRDILILLGGMYLLSKYRIRIPVAYLGKFATAFELIGFADLLINWPEIPGLGICDFSWLPGFSGEPALLGFWFVYAGIILAYIVAVYYVIVARKRIAEVKAERGEDRQQKQPDSPQSKTREKLERAQAIVEGQLDQADQAQSQQNDQDQQASSQ